MSIAQYGHPATGVRFCPLKGVNIIFIVLEGLDGCGKTHQAIRLWSRMADHFPQVLLTKEPGGSQLADDIKPALLHSKIHPITEMTLFAALRAEHVLKQIKPALNAGGHVICDRYAMSTYAYQGAFTEVDEASLLRALELGCCGVYPDLTILIDVPADFYHPGGTEEDQISTRGLAYRQAVRDRYLNAVQQNGGYTAIVDGTQSLNQVHEAIWLIVSNFLNLKEAITDGILA